MVTANSSAEMLVHSFQSSPNASPRELLQWALDVAANEVSSGLEKNHQRPKLLVTIELDDVPPHLWLQYAAANGKSESPPPMTPKSRKRAPTSGKCSQPTDTTAATTESSPSS